jgi:hypothetical protein
MSGLPRQGERPAAAVARTLRRRPGRPKGTLLYLFSAPLLAAAMWALASGRAGAALANAAAFVLFVGAAQLTRRGTGERGEGRALALGHRLPAVPLRNLGGALAVVATGFAAHFSVGHGIAVSVLFGAAAAAGFHLWYDFVPLRRPAVPLAPPSPAVERANAALNEAEGRIRDIEQASLAIGNPELKARLWRIALKARQILGHIGERPEAWRRARRFLTTYLEGTQQVTRGYVRTHALADERAGELEQNFRKVLVTIEEVFAEQEKRLLDSDLMDLDVQIEVLRKQLEQEGIL